MNGEKKRHGISLTVQLLLITVVPLLILGSVLAVTSKFALEQGMKKQTLSGLEGLDASVFTALHEFDYKDLTKNEDGIVKKGYYQLTGNYELVDNIKVNSGIDIAVFYGDELVVSSLKKDGGKERFSENFASEEAASRVLGEGSTFIDESVNIDGRNYYGYYMPLTNMDGNVAGMLFAGMESSGTEQYIKRQVGIVVGVSIALLFICIVSSVLFAGSIGKNIVETEKAFRQMAEGKLRFTPDKKRMKRFDEIGRMTEELNHYKKKVIEIIKRLQNLSRIYLKSGEELEKMAIDTEVTSVEIAKSFDDIEAGAVFQAEEVHRATEHVMAMGNVVSGIVTSMHQLNKTAGEIGREGGQSERIIEELHTFNERTEDAIDKVDVQIQKTNKSVHQIRSAVQIITSIADETTLLAMNANIEAARAGKAGKGFGVVANEIQRLAKQSNDSAEEIEQDLKHLLENSEMTVQIMSTVKSSVEQQRNKLWEAESKLSVVSSGIMESQKEVQAVMQEMEKCDQYQNKAVEIIQGILAVAEQNAANVEQTTTAMRELDRTMEILASEAEQIRSMSDNMKKELDYFWTE